MQSSTTPDSVHKSVVIDKGSDSNFIPLDGCTIMFKENLVLIKHVKKNVFDHLQNYLIYIYI